MGFFRGHGFKKRGPVGPSAVAGKAKITTHWKTTIFAIGDAYERAYAKMIFKAQKGRYRANFRDAPRPSDQV
jgi:hypothetical protein